ncbi:MAG TPA: ATP-binding cassette domain-containing protein [Acidimicrobiales bacterium]|nr:ATP-binding cassette domain-containing protein [Acidimicrobiales bacterium]
MASSGPAIEVTGLRKSFGSNVVLDGIDFSVGRGTVFSLLGPNGAGKTTVINILTTLLRADGGVATVNGFDVSKQEAAVRGSISLTGQFAAIDNLLTGRENLALIAELRHVANPARTAGALLERFGLVEAADRRTSTYSGGMRRKLDIALGLVGDPGIIFFDEPTTGLDPEGRNTTWDIIKSLAGDGKTVFLTTQYLEEADRLADRIAILSHGRIAAEGTPQALKHLLPHGQIELRFADATQLAEAGRVLADREPSRNDTELTMTVSTDGSVAQVNQLFSLLERAKLEVAEFAQKSPTLDDAFLRIINSSKGESHASV